MSVKGQEFPAYDARGIQGMGLAYATTNRGACHLRGYTVASEVLGIPVKTDPLTAEGKPELVKAFQDATAAFDSAGICIFTTFAWGLADLAPQVAAACGDEFTLENLAKIGERIWNMERDFNNRAGFTAKDDTPAQAPADRSRPRPARPRAWSASCPRCCPSTTKLRGWDSDGQLKPETRDAPGPVTHGAPAPHARTKAVPRDRLVSFLEDSIHETRHPRRRPGRRHRRRNHPQARAERRASCSSATSPSAVLAHGDSLPADRQHRRGRHAPAPRRRRTSTTLRIELRARRAPTQVDVARRSVALDDGSALRLRHAADRHRLQPGSAADPRHRPARRAHLLDAGRRARHRAALAKPGARVLQMGAGFIGCIIMEALAARGVQLTVVEMGDRMVPRMMGPTAGGMIKALVREPRA